MTLNALNCYGETKICHSISLNLYIHLGKRFNDKTMYIFAVLCTLEHFNTSVNFVVMCIVTNGIFGQNLCLACVRDNKYI